MAPIRQVAPGGGVELEVDPSTGHVAWRVAGRRSSVGRARSVAGDGAVDRILRDVVAQIRAAARDAADGERAELRDLAGRIWRGRRGDVPAVDPQERLF